MSKYIHDLIAQGENQHLDFKYCISDSKKIAKSLVAFANTEGGKLLIGVKDNGALAGIKEDEEYYMIEAAADVFCKPPVKFDSKNWDIKGKRILEIIIPESKKKPHVAKYENDKWQAFIRLNDQNHLANNVLIKVWEKEKRRTGIKIKYSKKEQILLDYLKKNNLISLTKFTKIARITRKTAENILANFIVWGIISYSIEENILYYKLNEL